MNGKFEYYGVLCEMEIAHMGGGARVQKKWGFLAFLLVLYAFVCRGNASWGINLPRLKPPHPRTIVFLLPLLCSVAALSACRVTMEKAKRAGGLQEP